MPTRSIYFRSVKGRPGESSRQRFCAELWLSPKTVETHVRSIFMKLGVGVLAGRDRRVSAVLAYLDAVEPERAAA